MKEYKKIIKRNARVILFFIIVLFFLYIVNGIYKNNIHRFDNSIYQIISNFINPMLTQTLKIITHFGDWMIMIPVSIAILVKNRKYGILVSINLITIFVLNRIFKLIFNRTRPIENRLIEVAGYSFPSGHSMVSMAFYGLLIYLTCKNVVNNKLKYAICICLSVLIFLIGFSRIYLGVHYASDVVGGFLLSLGYLILFTQIIKEKK